MKKWLLALSLLLAACAGDQAAQDRYYLLPDNPGKTEIPLSYPLLVVKIDLADYLNSNSLLYRTSQTEVVYAKHNLWAQSISQQLTRRIINDLYAKQTTYRPVELNSVLDFDRKHLLYIYLQKFNGAYTGAAEIAGEWFLLDKEGQAVRNGAFQIEVPLQQQGYDALLNSLSEGLGQLTDSIVGQL